MPLHMFPFPMQRRSVRQPYPEAVTTPAALMPFDPVYRGDRDPMGRPLRDRRARLEDVVAGSELV
jgi:ATP-dependent DNA ligase